VTATSGDTSAAIERLLDQDLETFYPLPAEAFEPTARVRTALDEFRSHDVPAGREAAAWLRDSALPEHQTSRTVLVLGRQRICAYYTLASARVTMTAAERADAGFVSPRKHVSATLLAWIARDPDALVTSRDLMDDATATGIQVHQLQANPILVLEAHDPATAEMWLTRGLGLRPLAEGRNRLWLPLV
jgi:hypothetical protein